MTDTPARSFQHYEVLRRPDGTAWELGRGAMGVTYKAFDVNLCCEVALKVVNAALVEHPEARERFVREARAAAALRHRNVASVYHLGNDGEHFFYAMEFINGETLDALVRRGGVLSVENALRVVLQVARALGAAERQHLVHRDIKPSNLMVTHEDADEETVVKVIDFGLARAAATAENAAPLTITGFVGTPQYASPEQLEERPLDARSDFYSLGVTAWFLLTGRAPFTGSLAAICQQQLTLPPPWEQLPPEVPTCVRGLLGHLLAKDAARRPQNAAELRAEIETCLEKVRGPERKSPLQLPVLPPTAAVVAPARDGSRKTATREWGTGTVLNRRYRLLGEVGGNHGVRVYRARDTEGDRLVAIKILPGTPDADAAGRSRLAEEVRLVQAAPHPRLVKICGLERSPAPVIAFLVKEWYAGFHLRDLLAGRGGALPVGEALRLLEQAAEAADHAASCRLGALDLMLTEVHVSFPGLATSEDDGPTRGWLPRRLAEWPDWTLKLDALRIHPDPLALDTWAGGATLVPTTAHDSPSAGSGVGNPQVRALANLIYELLGGVPRLHHFRSEPSSPKQGSLPVLNEEGNRLLRAALDGESTFAHGWELHRALVEAVGAEPPRGEPTLPTARTDGLPVAVLAANLPEGRRIVEEAPPEAAASTVTSFSSSEESVAPFFHDEPTDETHDSADPVMAGSSAWDRLSLVGAPRAHPGRWVAGGIGLAAVFVLGFVGVMAWLWQRMPAHAAVVSPTQKRLTVAPPPVAFHQPTAAPLAAHLPAATPPNVPATVEILPTPAPTVVAQVENVPPPPALVVESTPAPTAPPVRERSPMVRLDSVPPGAQIRLGSEVLGTTPFRVRLPRGDHELIARYQNWPETHQTLHLDGTETHPAVEIRLMRPDLVPGATERAAATPDNRVRKIFTPAAHRPSYAEVFTPSTRATPLPAPPPPARSEPEVRPAQRVLTPFRIDGPPEASPAQTEPANNRQPFTAEGDDGR